MHKRNKDDDLDWPGMWAALTSMDDDMEITLTEKQMKALHDFAVMIGKMNPPEDPSLPLDIRKDNDVQFRKYLRQQFSYLEPK